MAHPTRPALSLSLQTVKPSYRASEKERVTFTVTNDSDRDINLLQWLTPLEGFKSDMFTVEVDGRRVPYIGRLYKRGAPTPEDYVTIPRNESRSETIDLSEAYDIARAGIYTVSFKAERLHVGTARPAALAKRFLTTQRTARVDVTANTTVFTLLSDRPARTVDGISIEAARRLRDDGPLKSQPPTFSGCTASRQTDLRTALTTAEQLARSASLALSNAGHCAHFTGARYLEWFGASTTARYNTVSQHFSSIADALANQRVTFNCDCSENYYAYVHAGNPYEIFLCNLFWSAPMNGTDSKAGTLIHEMSHFTVVAGTDDHTYGQPNCRSLANTNPDQAIDNADSHEYFAENTPTLTMDPAPAPVVPMTPNWRNLPAGFTSNYDAALNGAGPFAGKMYFFKGTRYVRYDWASDRADTGYPKDIGQNWHSMPAGFTGSFDTAVNGKGPFAGKAYFFKGDKYIRYDWAADRADPGYPATIQSGWHNLPAGFTDSWQATMTGNGPFAGKLYVFKGDSYIRYDWQQDRCDAGYPRKVSDLWFCMPSSFFANFDAAVEGDLQWANRGYFFKGGNYVRYNWADDHAE